LYDAVQETKQAKANRLARLKASMAATHASQSDAERIPIVTMPLRGEWLRQKRYDNHCQIRQRINETGSEIIHRTQAQNKKCAHQTIEEAQALRGEVVADQLRTWRSMLPGVLTDFSNVPDYRHPRYVKHKVAVLMMYGLLALISRLRSRRGINRELTGPVITESLRKLFPELESIPHADTLARLLAHTDPKQIEAIHIRLIAQLIRKKKFKKLLIHGCVPITIDGTQKLVREDLLHDDRWCERKKANDP
ncbi:MAG: transposase family protein, partial [Gammaproteobacteria bacterium]|nr:transposase family protein [Gammaproteobacteria bacterium]